METRYKIGDLVYYMGNDMTFVITSVTEKRAGLLLTIKNVNNPREILFIYDDDEDLELI